MIRLPPLAPTLAALPMPPREGITRLAAMSFRCVQISVAQPGLRPRDLDQSGRRDLLATLRRNEMACSGIDLWIPAEHFNDPGQMDRAVGAIFSAIELASDLGRIPVSTVLPGVAGSTNSASGSDELRMRTADEAGIVDAIIERANRFGVTIANFAHPPDDAGRTGIGIDAAGLLSHGADPAAAINRLGKRIEAVRISGLSSTGLRVPPGSRDGRIDLLSLQIALNNADLDGPVVLDARQWNDPLSHLEPARKAWESASPF